MVFKIYEIMSRTDNTINSYIIFPKNSIYKSLNNLMIILCIQLTKAHIHKIALHLITSKITRNILSFFFFKIRFKSITNISHIIMSSSISFLEFISKNLNLFFTKWIFSLSSPVFAYLYTKVTRTEMHYDSTTDILTIFLIISRIKLIILNKMITTSYST